MVARAILQCWNQPSTASRVLEQRFPTPRVTQGVPGLYPFLTHMRMLSGDGKEGFGGNERYFMDEQRGPGSEKHERAYQEALGAGRGLARDTAQQV